MTSLAMMRLLDTNIDVMKSKLFVGSFPGDVFVGLSSNKSLFTVH